MRKIVLFAFLFPVLAQAQQVPTQKVITLSPGYDAGSVLLPATGGGYAIFGRQTAAPGAKTDAFFLRVDNDGNQITYKKYGEANANEVPGKGVLPLASGWLLSGYKEVVGSVGWLLRLSPAGDALWSKEIPGVNRINQLVPLPAGGFLATGVSAGRMFLMNVAEDGTVLWQQNYSAGEGRDLYVTEGGNACVVLGRNKLWKVHLVSRQVQWEQNVIPPTFGPTGLVEVWGLTAIAPLGTGRFAIIGSAYTELATELYSGHFAAVWSEAGTPIWQKFLRDRTTGYDQNEGTSLWYLPNSKSILFVGTDQGKVAVTRTDLNGKIVDEDLITTPGEMYSAVLIKDAGRYVMTGAILTSGINTYFYRSADNSLAKQAPIDAVQATQAEAFRLLQNPGEPRVTVEIVSATEREGLFQLWDVLGHLVWEKPMPLLEGPNRVVFETDTLAPGVYWLGEVRNALPPKALHIQKF